MIKREDLKVGEKYYDSFGKIVVILFISKAKIFAMLEGGMEESQPIEYALLYWSLIPKPKKKLWIWDCKDKNGNMARSNYYLDEERRLSTGELSNQCIELVKKYEDQFIEVEEA